MKDHPFRIATTLTVLALVVGAACLAMQGPLPGDVQMTLGLQALFGSSPNWAEWLTDMARPPLLLATIVGGAALAWWIAGWRAALAVPMAFGLTWLIDKALRAILFVQRPAADLVDVASPSDSSGVPSTFGLVFGSVFGVALLARARGRNTTVPKILAVLLIVAGASARVVLGGHWSSQMAASVLLGFAAASAAHAATNLVPPRVRPHVS